MTRTFRIISGITLSALGLSLVSIPNAMATTPTETAVFQCNLFTSTPFNLESYNEATNAAITLPEGATSSCMDLLEQLMNLGLTAVSVSYQTQSNGTNGNYMTFAMSNGTVGNL